MASRTPPRRQSIATKFQLKIAAEARAKEAEIRHQKDLDEQIRRANLKDPSELKVPEHHVVDDYPELFYRPETARSRREREDTEKEVLVPWQSSWSGPQTYAEPHVGLDPVHEIFPVLPEPLSGSQNLQMPVDSLAIQKLQADLESEQRHVRNLEQDLQYTTHQVELLRAERDEATRQYVQAVCTEAKAEAERLEAQVVELRRQWETSLQHQRRLEDEIERGRCKELELGRLLENARRETRQLKHEIEADSGRRMSTDTERKVLSKARGEKVGRRSTNKANDTMTIKRTTVDYAIVVPKKRNARRRGGCFVM